MILPRPEKLCVILEAKYGSSKGGYSLNGKKGKSASWVWRDGRLVGIDRCFVIGGEAIIKSQYLCYLEKIS